MTEQNTSVPSGSAASPALNETSDTFVEPENEAEAAAWKRVEAALDEIAKEEHLTPAKGGGSAQAQPRDGV